MKPGSKYYPLFAHLQHHHLERADSSERAELTLTLAEIEHLIDNRLPDSARKRAWWSNRDGANAAQAAAWIQAGYHVEAVDFERQTVTFQTFKAEYTVQRQGDAILWNQDAVRALRKHMSLTQAKFAQEFGVRRQTVSEWENGVYEPDRSTAKHLERVAQQQGFEP